MTSWLSKIPAMSYYLENVFKLCKSLAAFWFPADIKDAESIDKKGLKTKKQKQKIKKPTKQTQNPLH